MFRGTSFHTIDAKGRLIIPSRFRDVIMESGENLMVTRLDGMLVAYTAGVWNSIENRILIKAQKSDAMRSFRRFFIGGVQECARDKQERILISPPLREYAGLEKDVVLIGVTDHFEILSRANWDNENKTWEDISKQEDVRNEIAGLGL